MRQSLRACTPRCDSPSGPQRMPVPLDATVPQGLYPSMRPSLRACTPRCDSPSGPVPLDVTVPQGLYPSMRQSLRACTPRCDQSLRAPNNEKIIIWKKYPGFLKHIKAIYSFMEWGGRERRNKIVQGGFKWNIKMSLSTPSTLTP